jgi:hypothetical protein
MSWSRMSWAFSLLPLIAGCAGPAPLAQPAGQAPATVGNTNQQAARARLRAVLRDQSFLEHLSAPVRATTISEPFFGHMVILYLVDDRGAARGAQAADLAESGVTREALRAVVEWNLAHVLVEPLSCTSHAVTEPAHHGYYESSRLLLDKQWAELAAQAGTVVVAAPSNDTLWVACNPTAEVLQKLAVVVQNTYPRAARPVSSSLLTWSKDGWRELPAP